MMPLLLNLLLSTNLVIANFSEPSLPPPVIIETIFQDGFESGTLDPAFWTAWPGTDGGLVIVEDTLLGIPIAQNGQYAVAMGRSTDGAFTINALDLQLDLEGQQNVFLEYWVYDYADEFQVQDGIWMSDDGGATFVKVFGFRPDRWANFYGKLPPLPLDRLIQQFGLQYTDQFVIRFQQADNADFNTFNDEDGFFIDDVHVYSQAPEFAALPFTEDFETGTLSDNWKWAFPDQTASANDILPEGFVLPSNFSSFDGTFSLALGRNNDDNYSAQAVDLFLNLDGYAQVDLSFYLLDFFDENQNDDAIFFSDDGGQSFQQVFQFLPQNYPDNQFNFFEIDVDSLAAIYNISLTSQFVIRFQQADNADFNTFNDEDGFLIDAVSVQGQLISDEPIITSFSPMQGLPGQSVDIQGQRFTPQAQVFFNGVPATQVTFNDTENITAIVPPLATTGKVKVTTEQGVALSNEVFTLLNQQVIFFEDWESGTLRSMWTANSSTNEGLITVAQEVLGEPTAAAGFYAVAIGKSSDGANNLNTLDLQLPMAQYQGQDVSLSFLFRDFADENQPEDLLLLSNDGGETFVPIYTFDAQDWNNDYGQLPPFDLDQLTEQAGLTFTDQFVIRFQQYDNADFNSFNDEDGWFIDNILIQLDPVVYATLPFQDGFEAEQLSPAWKWRWPNGSSPEIEWTRNGGWVQQTEWLEAVHSGDKAIIMGRRSDGNFTVNALDLHLNLQGQQNVFLEYWLYDYADEFQVQDGIWMSDDGGENFVKVFGFRPDRWANFYGKLPPLPLDRLIQQFGLQYTDQFIIRFQQADNADFDTFNDEDGFFIDDVHVYSQAPEFATLPFTEDFETGTLSDNWKWAFPDQTASANDILPEGFVLPSNFSSFDGTFSLALGRNNDDNYSAQAVDLFLNLDAYAQVDLSFYLLDFFDENQNDDAIFFSDDGGQSFQQVFQFLPQNYPDNQFNFFEIDVDSLAAIYNISLTSQFVIRFQQADNADFNTFNDEDGFLIDAVSVQGQLISDEPIITSFSPMQGLPGQSVDIQGQRFTPQAQVFFNGVPATQVTFNDTENITAIVPPLATTGKIRVTTEQGIALSNEVFTLLNQQVIFFEDWESGTLRSMWTANSSTNEGLITVAQEVLGEPTAAAGFYAVAIGKSSDGANNLNTLDLQLPMAQYQGQDVSLSFLFRDFADENQPEDLLLLSNDGGETFVPIYTFDAQDWNNDYGQLPPFDLDQLTEQAGLTFTDQFVIRFQQYDNADFNSFNDEDGWFIDNILIQLDPVVYASLPFQDGFEAEQLSPAWKWRWPNGSSPEIEWTRNGGWVQQSEWLEAVHSGDKAIIMGRRSDGNFTVNALDLHLNLQGQQNVFLEYWLYDYADEFQVQDGIWMSDDGGATFVKVFGFRPDRWANFYGKLPPLPLDRLIQQFGLQYTDQFIICFQQADNADFDTFNDEDGFFIDDVHVYSQAPEFATLPFSEDFETGTLSDNWKWAFPDQTASANDILPEGFVFPSNFSSFDGTFSLALGRNNDDNYSAQAIDLFLNLDAYAQVDLSFYLLDFFDENQNDDAIFFSDDGGQSFQQVFQFLPQNYPDNQFNFFEIDVDSLAAIYNISLSSQFVIRFQQADNGDFNTFNDEDGFLIDAVSVQGQLISDEPIITSFSPMQGLPGQSVDIQGQRFTPQAQVFFNGVPATQVTFIDTENLTAIVPPLATTGKIRVTTEQGVALSNEVFTLLNQQVIFFEDWESGTLRSMWTANSSTNEGLITVAQEVLGEPTAAAGFYAVAIGKSSDGANNLNTLDLQLPMAQYQGQDVSLSFLFRDFADENQPEDLLLLSNDGGETFVPIYTFDAQDWNNDYGQLPPFDLDQLTEQAGLTFTDQFVIRFQQYDNADFNSFNDEDGWFIDNILIQLDPVVYATLPFQDGFEAEQLSPAWKWRWPNGSSPEIEYTRNGGWVQQSEWLEAVHSGDKAIIMGRRSDGNFTVNALDLHLNLQGQQNVELNFWLRDYADENHDQDGIWMSSDGGNAFTKIWSFVPQSVPDSYHYYQLNIDSLIVEYGLTPTSTSIIRFQQADNADFNTFNDEDGFFLDDIEVTGVLADNQPKITYFTPNTGYDGLTVTIKGLNLSNTNAVAFNGQAAANFTNIDANTVEAIVPTDASTGLISLTTPFGTAFSPYDFTIIESADLGVTEIISPNTDCGLSNAETIQVRIRNFGGTVQSSFEVGYQINGNPAIIETVNMLINSGEELEYTFAQAADLSNTGAYEIEAFTNLGIDGNISNNSTTKNIDNYPAFAGSISGQTEICAGQTTTLTASGGEVYFWSINSNSPEIVVSPPFTTAYSVTITNEQGCEDVQMITVNVSNPPVPEISIDGSTTLCEGASVTLTSSITDNIQWSTGAVTPSIVVDQAGNYQVFYFGPDGCNSESEVIQVVAATPLSIQSAGDGVVCEGESETLSVPGATSLSWSTGANTPVISVSPTENTNYSVTVTDAFDCTYILDYEITVIPDGTVGTVSNMIPEDGADGLGLPVAFSWAPASNATLYDFYLWEDGSLPPTNPTFANLSVINFEYSNLLFNTTHNWQIIAKNACNTGEAGPIQSFTIRELPDLVVSNITPPSGAVFSGTEAVFEWSIQNIGAFETGAQSWVDAIYLSTDTNFDPFTDEYLGYFPNLSSLPASISYTNNLTLPIPDGLEGDFYIIVQADRFGNLLESNEDNNVLVSSQPLSIQLTPPPDLRPIPPLEIGANNTVIAGESYTLEWEVVNQGFGPTRSGGWQDRVYISDDPIFQPATSPVSSPIIHNGNLNVGQSYFTGANITIPENASGSYYLFFRTDLYNSEYEHNFENNNVQQFGPFEVVGMARPDLQIDEVTVTPLSVSNKEQITVEYVGRNAGIPLSDSWRDGIYLSTSQDPVDIITQIGFVVSTHDLDTDETYTGSRTVTIPDGYTGSYYVIVRADYNNAVPESIFENNNTNASANPISVLTPNLTVAIVEAPGTATSGSTINLGWQVFNFGQGTLHSSSLYDQIYLSADPVLSGNDLVLNDVNQPAIIFPQTMLPRSKIVAIPEGLEGDYYLIVHTNADNGDYENGMVDDNFGASPITIEAGSYPDFFAQSIQANVNEAFPGTQIEISYNVQNNGTGTALGSWIDRVYLSTSPVWSGSGLWLKSILQSQAIASGQTYNETFSVTLPPQLNPGNYYLHLLSDVDDDFYETDETNNITSGNLITINALPNVNLAIQQLIGPSSLMIGEPAGVSFSVKNIGSTPTPANNWLDGLYLSTDPSWNPAEDVLIQEWQHNGALGANAFYTQFVSFTVPQGYAGTFYLLLVTDHTLQNPDTNPNNNYLVLSDDDDDTPVVVNYPPAPDLEVETFDVPMPVTAGQPFTVQYTVRNTGPGSLSNTIWLDKVFLSQSPQPPYLGLNFDGKQQALSLNPGEAYSDSITLTIPLSVSEGNYYLVFHSDRTNAVAPEADETNNRLTKSFNLVQLPPGDLVVEDVIAPSNLSIGEEFTLNWTTRNQGINTLEGQMQEAVYLSTDNQFDNTDILLATNTVAINLGQNGTIGRSLEICLQNARNQDYYLIVRTDLLNNFPETEELNNSTPTADPIAVSVPLLMLNQLTPNELTTEKGLYYRLVIPAPFVDAALRLTLDSESPSGANELYLSHLDVPSRITYDYSFQTPFSPDQEIIVPFLEQGTYYILVYPVNAVINPQPITLLAEIIEFGIDAVVANQGGNTGSVTVKMTGARFEEDMEVWLENSTSGPIIAQNYQYISSTAAFVTFNLSGTQIGLYDLKAMNGAGDVSSLDDGFTIVEGTVGNTPLQGSCSINGGGDLLLDSTDPLAFEPQYPASTRPNRTVTITLRYENVGNVDIPIPRRQFASISGAPISQDIENFDDTIEEIYLEFTEDGGPANILRPGGVAIQTIYTRAVNELRFKIY